MTAVRVSPSTAAISSAGSQMLAGIRTARNGVFAIGLDALPVASVLDENAALFQSRHVRDDGGEPKSGVVRDGLEVLPFVGDVRQDGAGGLVVEDGVEGGHFVLPCRCVYTVSHRVYLQRKRNLKKKGGDQNRVVQS